MSLFPQQVLERAEQRAVAEYRMDFERVLALPRRAPLDCERDLLTRQYGAEAQALAEYVTEQYALPPRKCACPDLGHASCITQLNPVQSWILREIKKYHGAVGLIAVGGGKTIASILAPLAVSDCKVAVLLAKPDQRIHYWNAYLRLREHFRVPSFVFDRLEDGFGAIVKGAPVLHFVPYSLLSQAKSTELLERMNPDLIVADECFVGNTKITTRQGQVSIKDIVDDKMTVEVLSQNNRGVLEWKRVVRWWRRDRHKQLVRVDHENGFFVCTYDHKIWTDNGYVKAGQLKSDQILFSLRKEVRSEHKEYQTLLGGVQEQEKNSDCRMSVLQCLVSNTNQREEHSEILFDELCPETHPTKSAPERSVEEASQRCVAGTKQRIAHRAHEETRICKYTLSDMQGAVSAPKQRQSDSSLLFQEMHVRERRESTKNTQSECRTITSRLVGVHEEEQSHVPVRGSSEDEAGSLWKDVSGARRQQQADRSAENSRENFGLVYGVCDSNMDSERSIFLTPYVLQGRFRRSSVDDRNRSRRELSQEQEMDFFGPSQDRSLTCSRVVSVTILESGSVGEYGGSVTEDPFVYDLEVEDNHNYLANGVLVSNCHSVSARTSSRTNRLLRYLSKRQDIRFCAWSGTLVKKSIKDQAHLMGYALGLGSPMPIDEDDVAAWAGVFDPAPVPDTETSTAKKLYRAFDRTPERKRSWSDRGGVNEGVRQGYRDHVLATPGVISTRESSVGCSLPFYARTVEIPAAVKKALVDVRELMKRPDGEELVEATEIAACARNVASGFYFYWAFPGIPCTCPPSVVIEQQRCEHCQFINEWYKRRSAWNSELRTRLQKFEPHMDSPLLCTNAARRAYEGCSCGWQPNHNHPHGEDRGEYIPEILPPDSEGVFRNLTLGTARKVVRGRCDLPVWRADKWPAWADIKDDVDYSPRVKFIDDFFARDAAEWAKEHRGIVWTLSSAFGRKVAELAGIEYHGGGPQAEANILAEKGDRSIVASLKAHGTGRDSLQYKFRKQYFAEPPASGDVWQQALGRLARPGQEADSVETWVARHSHEVKEALRNAIRDAEFTESMTGNKQLLLAADMDFL